MGSGAGKRRRSAKCPRRIDDYQAEQVRARPPFRPRQSLPALWSGEGARDLQPRRA